MFQLPQQQCQLRANCESEQSPLHTIQVLGAICLARMHRVCRQLRKSTRHLIQGQVLALDGQRAVASTQKEIGTKVSNGLVNITYEVIYN